jgi:hypothetical protein
MLAVAAGKDGDSKRRGSFVRSVIFGSCDVFLEKPSVSNGIVKAKSRAACRADTHVTFGLWYVQRHTPVAGSAVASLA